MTDSDVILDTAQIGDVTRVLRQLAACRKPEASRWASQRLDRLGAGESITRDDVRLVARLEEEILIQRTINRAMPSDSVAAEEDARAMATARAAARKLPSVYLGRMR